MKSLRNNLVFFITVVVILIAVSIVFLADAATTQAAIGMLVLSTALTAISSIATYMQAVEAKRQRESAERPEVAVYFQSVNRLMYCIIQNFGTLPARNIHIQFNPLPVRYDGMPITEISLFKKPITYLPPSDRYWRQLGASPAVLAANKQPFEIVVQYESTSGNRYEEIVIIDLSVLTEANEPEPTVTHQLDKISQHLGKIVTALETKNEPYHP